MTSSALWGYTYGVCPQRWSHSPRLIKTLDVLRQAGSTQSKQWRIDLLYRYNRTPFQVLRAQHLKSRLYLKHLNKNHIQTLYQDFRNTLILDQFHHKHRDKVMDRNILYQCHWSVTLHSREHGGKSQSPRHIYTHAQYKSLRFGHVPSLYSRKHHSRAFVHRRGT